MKVLIVDDVDANLYLLRVLMTNAGYDVVEAINGQEALDVAKKESVDLVVSDILMPTMDGFEFCKIWKSSDEFKKIPFIFYTATYTEAKDREFALNIGADLFLVKPMESYNLLREVEKVINNVAASPVVSGTKVIADNEYYEKYSSRLVKKLEAKLLQLEQKNHELMGRDANLRQLNGSLEFQLSKVQLTEKNLREHESELLSIVNSMAEGVLTTDDKGVIYEFNPAAEKIFGYDKSEVVGKTIDCLMPEKKRAAHKEQVKRFSETQADDIVARDMIAVNKKGIEVPIRLSVARLPETNLKRSMFICSFLDVSKEKQQEEIIARSHKMEAIGTLSGGIAHDYNNMLGIILGYTELLTSEALDDKLKKYIDSIAHAAERGVSLTRKLLSFSKKSQESEELVNLNQLILDNVEMIKKLLMKKVELNLELNDETPMILINKNEFEDCLLNLCINAMHAMPDGGRIDIETSRVTLEKDNSKGLASGEYLKFVIADTGCGMSEDVRSRVFEPFFTTKGSKGTGLGLSQAYGFVERSNGFIELDSEINKGTRFTFYFPASTEIKYQKVSEKKNTQDAIKEEVVILVVDDESALLKLIEVEVKKLGCEVITAADGYTALEILSKRNIKLLLSDIVMPTMDGFKLAEIAKELYPDLEVLLMSGYNEGVDNKQDLQKPFSMSELRSAIMGNYKIKPREGLYKNN